MTVKIEPHKIIVFVFFALYLCMGLFLFKDYGISFDEWRSRENGIVSFNYIVKGDQELLFYQDRIYGTFFETVLYAFEKGLNLTNNYRAIYLMRHLATFLLFYLGVIYFYKLCKKIFHHWSMALLGCIFLILSPRIFADAFYNSKDIPCLSLFIISTYTLVNYLENKTFVNAIIHAFASSVLIDIRILGILIPAFTLLFSSIDIGIIFSKGLNPKKYFLTLLSYCFILVVLTTLFWPYLWTSPVQNFIYALFAMSHFYWPGIFLYLGKYIKATNLPWYYIPMWIAISTPLAYVITFCIGYGTSIISAGRDPGKFYSDNKHVLINLLLITLPILSVVLFKSVLYDAWRQMYFVYPAFLIFSLIGLRELFNFVRLKLGSVLLETICIILIISNLSCVCFFMIKNHPYQNVYFNCLAGRNMEEIKDNFELDYWGLSYTKALEYIVSHDSDHHINIYVDGPSWGVDVGMLDSKDSDRLVFVNNIKVAKYLMSDFRWHKNEYHYKNEYYSIKVEGEPIMVVYRL